MLPEKLPIGTKIIFNRTLTESASGDRPAILFASKGETGQVVGYGCAEGYKVKADAWPTWFGASSKEFEVIE